MRPDPACEIPANSQDLARNALHGSPDARLPAGVALAIVRAVLLDDTRLGSA